MAHSTTRGFGRESAITFAGIIVNAGLAFVVTWIVAGGLGAAAAGVFFQLTGLFIIVGGVVALGADTGLVRSLAALKATNSNAEIGVTARIALVPVIVTTVGASILLWITAPVIADLLVLDTNGVATVRVLAAILLPATLLGVLLAGSRGLGSVRTYTVVQNLFVPVARLICVAIAVYMLGAAWAVVWGWALPLVLAAAIAAVAFAVQLRRATGQRQEVSAPEKKRLSRDFWSFALPRAGSGVLERGLDWIDVLLVIALLGPVAGGIYGVATRIVQAGGMLESAVRIVLGPRISGAAAREEHDESRMLYQRATQLLILASWPFYLAIMVFAGDVLSLFGEEFRAGAPALIVLALARALRNTVGALQTVLLMAGRSTWQLLNKLVQLVVMVGLIFVMVPLWGITGAAIAVALSVVVDTVMAAFQVHARLGYSADAREVLQAAALPLVVVLGGSVIVSVVLWEGGAIYRFVGLAVVLAAYVITLIWVVRMRRNSGE